MKKLLLSCLIALLAVSDSLAAKREFKAVAINVDGLPPVVHIEAGITRDIEMNPDGSVDVGATRMGQLIQQNLWDIVGLSEDFNYHDYLVAPLSDYYNVSTYRGKIEQNNLDGSVLGYLSQSVHMNTDGLCLLSRKKTKVLEEVITQWKDHYGYDDHGADGLIKKGFRFYQVNLEGKLTVDVYILHMDAEDSQGDIDARTAQLKQLADAIIASDNKNPIIILGDTNCRYTRDTLKETFIDRINADSRFEIHDPWIEFQRDGIYPEFGTGAIMTGQWGQQKGEVVDKIFYINNTDSECTLSCQGYLHDDSFTYADGSQISDHYPVVASMTIEGPDVASKPEFVIPEAPVKGAIVAGNTYYARNVATGKFMRAGGSWNKEVIMGDYGMRIKLEAGSAADKFKPRTTHSTGYIGHDGNYWVDKSSTEWTFTQVKDNVYTLTDAEGNALGCNDTHLAAVSANPADQSQQWEFLTDADMRHEFYYATSSKSADATFLMKAPDFFNGDSELSGWTKSKGNNATQVWPDDTANGSLAHFYNSQGFLGSSSGRNWSMSQTITNVPAGTYIITYQLLTYNMSDNLTFTINGANADFENVGSDPGKETVITNFANGSYAFQKIVTVTNDDKDYPNKININLDKKATGSATGMYVDNFQIKCVGLEGSYDKELYDRVKAAIDDAQNKADELGLAYNNRAIEILWEEQSIAGDGWDAIKMTYQNLALALLKQQQIPFDYTSVILNPSFELYPEYKDGVHNIAGTYPFGWDYPSVFAFDSGVWPADDPDKHTSNPDGERIYNTWDNGKGGYELSQSITLSPGIYELTAMVTSDTGNSVYIYAGDNRATVQATGQEELVPVKLHFIVYDAKPIKIGVGGQNSVWYKADNFHLTHLGLAEDIDKYEFLPLAIKEVKEKASKLGKTVDLSYYEDMVNNIQVKGDGWAEFHEIYGKLGEIVYANTADNADYTPMIANSSFEWGNLYGWNTTRVDGDDTGVKSNSDTGYRIRYGTSVDGKYIFNIWSPQGGFPVTQTIKNMPAGKYRLQAVGASDKGNALFLTANNYHSDAFICSADKENGMAMSFDFNLIEDGDLTIGIVGGSNGAFTEVGGVWYKADHFRLTRLGEAEMTEFYEYLQQVIDWATDQANTLPDAYKAQWDMSYYQALIDEKTLQTDGRAEAVEIFAKLRELVLSQEEEEADMTIAIINNSFEMGNTYGWDVIPSSDTQATKNVDPYTTNGIDGEYLFNNWWQGTPITQTIPGVKAGRYRVNVLACSGDGEDGAQPSHFILANGTHGNPIFLSKINESFQDVSYTFDVLEDGDLTIGFVGGTDNGEYVEGGHWWYKIDNFRLTLVNKFETLDAPEGSLDEAAQELTLTAAEGASIYYAVTFDGSEPAEVNTLYTGPIDLNAYLDDDVYVWAMASQEGFISSEVVNVLDGYYVAIDPENTVIYSPVTDEAALTNESWYIIVANHAEGHHAMGADHKGAPVQVNSKGNIVANEALFADVVEFQLLGDGINWTMNAKNGEVTLGPVAPASGKASAPRAAGDMTISLGSATEGAIPANITWADGSTLGFHHDAKEFGYTQAHSAPVMLYTTGKDMNTGVGNVAADDDAEVEYYNLQGVRIMNPGKGLYIRRQGNKATKVVL